MTFAFIITGENHLQGERYRLAARAAMLSVRHFHPRDRIVCLCDQQTAAVIGNSDRVWSGILDDVIPCPDAKGGPTHRSRVIKTSLRKRLAGPFIFLDSDTFLLQDLGPLLACDGDLGLTADAYFTTDPGLFPSWVRPLFTKQGWASAGRYFNSGVMFVADTPPSHLLFNEWQVRYEKATASGFFQDQPAFNATIAELHPRIVEYPESFNFICGREPRQVPLSARLIHLFLSSRTTTMPAYDSILEDLGHDIPLTVEAMVHRLRMNPGQQHPRWYLFRVLTLKLRDIWQRSLPERVRSSVRHR